MKAKVASHAGGDRLAVKKGGKAEKDPNKPKRPLSAFFVFIRCREGFKKEYKEKYPNNKQVSVVGKAGGEKWKSLTNALIMPCFQFLTKFVEQIHAMELLKRICKKIIRRSLTLKEAPVPTYDSRSSYLHCDVNKHCHIWWSGGESKDALLASLGICYQLTGMKRSEI